MPTIPPSVFSSTTLRRKYGPWQPLAASSGGSGSAIGVTFSPVIVNRSLAWIIAPGGVPWPVPEAMNPPTDPPSHARPMQSHDLAPAFGTSTPRPPEDRRTARQEPVPSPTRGRFGEVLVRMPRNARPYLHPQQDR